MKNVNSTYLSVDVQHSYYWKNDSRWYKKKCHVKIIIKVNSRNLSTLEKLQNPDQDIEDNLLITVY